MLQQATRALNHTQEGTEKCAFLQTKVFSPVRTRVPNRCTFLTENLMSARTFTNLISVGVYNNVISGRYFAN